MSTTCSVPYLHRCLRPIVGDLDWERVVVTVTAGFERNVIVKACNIAVGGAVGVSVFYYLPIPAARHVSELIDLGICLTEASYTSHRTSYITPANQLLEERHL